MEQAQRSGQLHRTLFPLRTLRTLDADELDHYTECTTALSRQEKELAGILGQERLEKYTGVQDELDHFLQQAIFRRGLALGLRLGALAVQ